MVTTGAALHGDRERLLAYDPAGHPLALQLGGCDPGELARCARIAADFDYDEVNLNVGCPSDRVQSGRFGACLMAEPELVADGVATMRTTVNLPITVKTRIGIDDRDSYESIDGLRRAGRQRWLRSLHHPRPQSLAAWPESQKTGKFRRCVTTSCTGSSGIFPT